MHESVSLEYEPSSEPLHISAKKLFLNRVMEQDSSHPGSLLYECICDYQVRCRSKMAHIRHSRPDSVLNFQAKALKSLKSDPPSLGRGPVSCFHEILFSSKDFKRRGNNLKRFKDFCLHDKARIWHWLSYMCHVRVTAERVHARARNATSRNDECWHSQSHETYYTIWSY